ncbi:putative diguanylate cyclase [Magnetofaba australis IT-1]|uniref:diguanylate cyclase n=1 Tax=Magnetofaba australis IT-1 TaxID=1434232 RepID=A0A1Y2K016_9PROT|nr:putative diguanylate cyclase [Magnetofaba australis IT-1]
MALLLLLAVMVIGVNWFFHHRIVPLIRMVESILGVVRRGREGDFTGRVQCDHCEGGLAEIAANLNRLMDHLRENLGKISDDVAKLIHYNVDDHTNQLSSVTEVVEALVEVSQFKQQIEEDLTKREVYQRISQVLETRFGLQRFSIYEVSASQNRMHPMVLDGAAAETGCRWCRHEVQYQAELCRAQRTGHMVDGVTAPAICNQFVNAQGERSDLRYMCIPVIHSGSVGNVVQLVVEHDHGIMFQLLRPFIEVYLRESASVIESKRLMEKLRESALRDALTGLHNRRFLEEFAPTAVAASERKGQTLAVLMMDLDHFKMVNDTYGHQAGDTVLKSLSQTLQTQVRAADLVVRYGGEEFLVVLQCETPGQGAKIAEKVRAAVEDLTIPISGGVLKKTISIGWAEFPNDAPDFWEAVQCADAALYRAKESGRNRVVHCSQGEEGEESEAAPASGAKPAVSAKESGGGSYCATGSNDDAETVKTKVEALSKASTH